MYLSYDTTFEGLLSALALCLKEQRDVWGIHPEGCAQTSLFFPVPVISEADILPRFDAYLCRRFGQGVTDLLFHAFLSGREDIEMRILGFLRIGLRIGGDPSGMLQENDVAAVRAAARAVTRQAHAYLGLLRFRLDSSVYVADFEPDYHVLPLVAPHFAARMNDRPFLIRDRRRSLAAVGWPCRPWFIVALDASDVPQQADVPQKADVPEKEARDRNVNELAIPGSNVTSYEDIWRSYFAVMAVPERINPSLQRSNMPKKYWKYLVERPGGGNPPHG